MRRLTTETIHKSAAAASVLTLLLLTACGQGPEEGAGQASGQVATSGPVVYEGARLIVGDGSAPIINSAFVVENGRFTAVGRAGQIEVPAGATRVDLTGRSVIPALIDAHVHLNTTREGIIDDLQRRAYFGVGAALSLGADDESVPLEIRDEVIPNAGRYRSAGLGITAPEPGRREVHWVTNEQEARQAVRDEAERNVDIIKIWVDDRDGQYEKLSPALYRAVIDEAHQNGLRVAAHIFRLEDAKDLLSAGIDVFAHGVRDQDVDDEFVAMIREHPDVILIPNLPGRGVATDLSWLAGSMPDAELQELQSRGAGPAEAREAYGIQARNLNRLNRAFVTIAFGTDGNTAWQPHVEMEDMVAAGMSPMQVIVAATQNAAAAAGFGDEAGTVAPGKSADFVVLEANPLEDIKNTRRIESVYLRGQMVDRAGLMAGWTS